MPSGAGFSSGRALRAPSPLRVLDALRAWPSSPSSGNAPSALPSRSTPMRAANTCRPTAGQLAYSFATVIGTSGCRCNSGHVFTTGCSSIAERVVGDDEAAGAIPATQTNGRRPTAGHRVVRLHTSPGSGRRRCLPSPRICRCNSCRSFNHATVPWIGTRVSEARWLRFNSSQWHHLRRGLGNRAGLQIRLTVRFDS